MCAPRLAIFPPPWPDPAREDGREQKRDAMRAGTRTWGAATLVALGVGTGACGTPDGEPLDRAAGASDAAGAMGAAGAAVERPIIRPSVAVERLSYDADGRILPITQADRGRAVEPPEAAVR
jgi:hypothetical protein